MGRKINRQNLADHPNARPVNAGKNSEPVNGAGVRLSQQTSPASRHPEAMRNGKLSRNLDGVPYVNPYCAAIRQDGATCRQPKLSGRDYCIGHMRSKNVDTP